VRRLLLVPRLYSIVVQPRRDVRLASSPTGRPPPHRRHPQWRRVGPEAADGERSGRWSRPLTDTEAQRKPSDAASSSCDAGLNSGSEAGTGGAAVEGAGLAVVLAPVGRVCGVASSCGAAIGSPNAPVAACGTSADGFTKVPRWYHLHWTMVWGTLPPHRHHRRAEAAPRG
jgi:hypothetical protein